MVPILCYFAQFLLLSCPLKEKEHSERHYQLCELGNFFQEITFMVLNFLLECHIIRNNPSITLSPNKRYTLLAWYWMT